MMTDPRRRHEIIATLSSLWAAYPQLRFNQLMALVCGDGDHFYMEDHEFYRRLVARLNETIKKEEL